MKYKLIRNVTKKECDWLARDFKEGEVVHRYHGCTYGCISYTGVACTIDGSLPFFELPLDAVKVLKEEVDETVSAITGF